MQVDVTLTLPRDSAHVSSIREVLVSTLRALEAPAEVADDLQVVLTEACANVIKHAGGSSQYRVDLAVEDARCVIEVSDYGPGFSPTLNGDAAPERDDTLDESGRGLALISALTDELHFERNNGDMRVRLVKHWIVDERHTGTLGV